VLLVNTKPPLIGLFVLLIGPAFLLGLYSLPRWYGSGWQLLPAHRDVQKRTDGCCRSVICLPSGTPWLIISAATIYLLVAAFELSFVFTGNVVTVPGAGNFESKLKFSYSYLATSWVMLSLNATLMIAAVFMYSRMPAKYRLAVMLRRFVLLQAKAAQSGAGNAGGAAAGRRPSSASPTSSSSVALVETFNAPYDAAEGFVHSAGKAAKGDQGAGDAAGEDQLQEQKERSVLIAGCLYAAALVVLVTYALLNFFLSENRADQGTGLGFVTASTMIILDVMVGLMYGSGLVTSPGSLSSVIALSRGAVLIFGARYWLIGVAFVYCCMGWFLAHASVERYYASLREAAALRALGGMKGAAGPVAGGDDADSAKALENAESVAKRAAAAASTRHVKAAGAGGGDDDGPVAISENHGRGETKHEVSPLLVKAAKQVMDVKLVGDEFGIVPWTAAAAVTGAGAAATRPDSARASSPRDSSGVSKEVGSVWVERASSPLAILGYLTLAFVVLMLLLALVGLKSPILPNETVQVIDQQQEQWVFAVVALFLVWCYLFALFAFRFYSADNRSFKGIGVLMALATILSTTVGGILIWAATNSEFVLAGAVFGPAYIIVMAAMLGRWAKDDFDIVLEGGLGWCQPLTRKQQKVLADGQPAPCPLWWLIITRPCRPQTAGSHPDTTATSADDTVTTDAESKTAAETSVDNPIGTPTASANSTAASRALDDELPAANVYHPCPKVCAPRGTCTPSWTMQQWRNNSMLAGVISSCLLLIGMGAVASVGFGGLDDGWLIPGSVLLLTLTALVLYHYFSTLLVAHPFQIVAGLGALAVHLGMHIPLLVYWSGQATDASNAGQNTDDAVFAVTSAALSFVAFPALVIAGFAVYKWADDGLKVRPKVPVIIALAVANLLILGVIVAAFVVYGSFRITAVILIAYVLIVALVTFAIVYKANDNYLPKVWFRALMVIFLLVVLGGLAQTLVEFFANDNILAAISWFSAAYLVVAAIIFGAGVYRLLQTGIYARTLTALAETRIKSGIVLYFSSSFLPVFHMDLSSGSLQPQLKYPGRVLGALAMLGVWGIAMLAFLSPAYVGLIVLESAKLAALIFVLDASARSEAHVREACEALTHVRAAALGQMKDEGSIEDGKGNNGGDDSSLIARTRGVYGAMRDSIVAAATELNLKNVTPSDVAAGSVEGVALVAKEASLAQPGDEVAVKALPLRTSLGMLVAAQQATSKSESAAAEHRGNLCNYMNVLPWCHVMFGVALGEVFVSKCPAAVSKTCACCPGGCRVASEYKKQPAVLQLGDAKGPSRTASVSAANPIASVKPVDQVPDSPSTGAVAPTAPGAFPAAAPQSYSQQDALQIAANHLAHLYHIREASEAAVAENSRTWLWVLAQLQHGMLSAGAGAASSERSAWEGFLQWLHDMPLPVLAQLIPDGAVVRLLKSLHPIVAAGAMGAAPPAATFVPGVSKPGVTLSPSAAIQKLLEMLGALGTENASHFAAQYVVTTVHLTAEEAASPRAVVEWALAKLGRRAGAVTRHALTDLRKMREALKVAAREAEEARKREDEEADRRRREKENAVAYQREAARRAAEEKAKQEAAAAEAKAQEEERKRREAREAEERRAAGEAARSKADAEAAAAAAAAEEAARVRAAQEEAERHQREEEARAAAAAAEIARLADDDAKAKARAEEEARAAAAAKRAAELAAASAAAAAAAAAEENSRAEAKRAADAKARADADRRQAEAAAAEAAARKAAEEEATRRQAEAAAKAAAEARAAEAAAAAAAASAQSHSADAADISALIEGGNPTGGIVVGSGAGGLSLEEAKAQVAQLSQLVKAQKFVDTRFQGKSAVGSDVRTELDDAWARPEEFADAPVVIEGGNDANDVSQGSLGDCWLLSAFSILAEHDDLMKQVLVTDERDEKGVVGVRLFKNGQWKLIVTDETFPIKSNVFSYAGAESSLYRGDFRQRDMRGKKRLAAPAFCTSGTRNELWPMYLEKAYARYFGSYSAIVGGLVHTALVDLTGQTGFCVDMRSEESKTDIRSGALFKRILGYHEAGYLMGCGSNSGSDSNTSAQGIVQGHAYSILNVVEASDQNGSHQLIRARNPWGSSEWKGKFSDFDKPSWTKRLRSKLAYDPDTEDSDDGAFWIGFPDFVTQFRNVYVLRRFKDKKEDPVNGWYKYTNHGEWKGATSGGNTSSPTSWKNPHYFLKASRPTTLFISITQHEAEGSGSRDTITAGFTVCSNGGKRVNAVYGGELPFGWGPFSASREASQEITVDDASKMYSLFVACWEAGQEAGYTLNVFSKHPLEQTEGEGLKLMPADHPKN